MENEVINKITRAGKISLTDYIYMSVIFVIIIIITIIFFHSTSFIVENINKIFSTTQEGNTQALDITRYSLIEKKLGLPKNNQTNQILDINTEKATIKDEVKITNEGKKKTIKISIINTTTKDGAATSLSKNLESDGFSKSTTGSKKMISSTVISIKESEKEYFESVKKIVEKSYPKISTTVNPENSDYDVIIIIGK